MTSNNLDKKFNATVPTDNLQELMSREFLMLLIIDNILRITDNILLIKDNILLITDNILFIIEPTLPTKEKAYHLHILITQILITESSIYSKPHISKVLGGQKILSMRRRINLH